MIGDLIKKIFGSKNDRDLKRIKPIVESINTLEPSFKSLTDEQLREKTNEFKERLNNGATLDDILPEAFSAVREASVRVLSMRHYDVQLIGGVFLHEGYISEMKTGEGKTLAATLPLYLNALSGRGVHLITVNDYLARRDAEWMGGIYRMLGMSVGVIVHGMTDKERKQAYACDITYGTNNEFGFDYLRDNMKIDVNELVQRDYFYAIVDEVDNILIDEARTPLIISGPVEHSENKIFMEAKPFVINLKRKQSSIIRTMLNDAKELLNNGEVDNETIQILLRVKRGDPKNPGFLDLLAKNHSLGKRIDNEESAMRSQKLLPELDKDLYCIIDERNSSVELTEKGIKYLSESGAGDFSIPDIEEESYNIRENKDINDMDKAERLRELEASYMRTTELLHATQQLIKAYWLFEKDVQYVIKDDEILIVDEFTGRMMPGRRWSDGLHQAVEAKEGVKVADENQTLATITFQNFFRMYEKLAGMTGTADTEAEEFHNIYKLEVAVIPTNKRMIRKDFADVIYKTEREKYNAVVQEIKELYEKGQPVLVGTISIEKSEVLSKMLKRAGVPHEVLNAKHHQKEAEIIAKAGQMKTVTISTNMAGRGTDIVLGEGVKELGGLHILGTERHESRRIDNQLRGRAGRQGDPGSSRFYLSLEDDLLRIFGSDRISSIMERLGMEEGEPIEANLISRAIEGAQKKVEAHNFDIRKHLLEYDDVMNKHREIIYAQRRNILKGEGIDGLINEMMEEKIDAIVNEHSDPKAFPEDWDIQGLMEGAIRVFGVRPRISADDIGQDAFDKLTPQALSDLVKKQVKEANEARMAGIKREDLLSVQKMIMLQILDNQWLRHLQDMDHLKEGIGLRGYAQQDPLKEYKKDAFELFQGLDTRIAEEALMTFSRIQLRRDRPEDIPQQKRRPMQMSHGDSAVRTEPIKRESQKIGRNDPCPCGSGKKYKKCCGVNE